MPNVKLPDDVYERVKKMAEEQGKAMWEVIKDALDKLEVGDIQINLPKPKFIRLQYPAWCVLGNHKIDPAKYREKYGRDPWALWFPGLNGVICIDCLVKHVFTDEVQAKTLAKLEVEIRRLRAIKRQLNKEIEDLAVKYSLEEILVKLSGVVEEIDKTMAELRDLARELVFSREDEAEKKKMLLDIRRKLEEIKEQLMKYEMPESWAKKIVQQVVARRRSHV